MLCPCRAICDVTNRPPRLWKSRAQGRISASGLQSVLVCILQQCRQLFRSVSLLLQKPICSPSILDSGFNHSRPLNKYHKSWSVVEDRIDGWWNQRFAAEFKMRALAGQKKTFLVSKKKNGDRTKRSRPSNAEASLDNAGAVIEGDPLLAIFER